MSENHTQSDPRKTEARGTRIATIAAGAAIGSAAIAAALLFASRQRNASRAAPASSSTDMPPMDRPQPETD